MGRRSAVSRRQPQTICQDSADRWSQGIFWQDARRWSASPRRTPERPEMRVLPQILARGGDVKTTHGYSSSSKPPPVDLPTYGNDKRIAKGQCFDRVINSC